jgi:predicted GIY-YIG superfamily endonuclease
MYFVYILECCDRSFYVGFTDDLSARLAIHQSGKGPAYTAKRLPVRVVYSEPHEPHEALQVAVDRERQLKGWSRAKKAALLAGDKAALKSLSKSRQVSAGRSVRRLLVLIAYGALVPRLSAGEGVDYVTQIKPILSARCYACHSALRKKSGLRLDTAAALIEGGDAGAAIQPGKASESYLIEMLTGASGTRMPPEDDGAALSAEQIALFKKWIDEGAHAPPETPQPDPREHWSYHPPERPVVPQVKNVAWVRNSIDAFIVAGHESRELTPVAEADKATLLRRVYLDLVGLPPTREELAAFLANDSPDAYENVVDHLLASPQYGERWGRHWMDVWRYSDWSGYKNEIRDSARHIWRWRDWIVESLNADKGYDRMAMEMLAGDELAPTDPNTLRATGFLVRNWYKFNRDTWLESTVEHTAKAFMGVTMNCCRCHDHKFDPISQVEYYQFRAIFEPHDVRTERVAGQADPLKDGLPRVCDLKPGTPTYLFERGDSKRPKMDLKIEPGVPEAFGSAMKAAPIDLPVLTYYPALQEFAIQEDLTHAAERIAKAEAAVTQAQVAVAAAQKRPDAKSQAEKLVAQAPQNGETAAPAKLEQSKAAAATPAPSSLERAVAIAELSIKQFATALASRESLVARVAADKAKYGLTPDADKEKLALAAGKAERELALCQAQEQQTTAGQELAVAKAALKPNDAASASAVAAAEKKVADAAAALAVAHAALAEPSAKYQPLGEELPHQSTGRRLAFAKWLVDRKNPLAARVAINHIWLRHFGAPLVDNMFDFGLRSPEPRNQPLLDWLAVELMDHGWQMKHVHRLIVTSNAYRMSSGTTGASSASIERDRDNRYLWRMNTRRLEAEVVRDAVFFAAGNLDLTRGGPDIAFKLASSTPRRSIYFQHAYEKENQLLELFDSASVNECYRRSESIVPQQALALANSDVSVNQSRVLAKQLSEVASKDAEPESSFVRLAFEQILSRDPSIAELAECQAFLKSQAELLREPSKLTTLDGGAKAMVPASGDPMQRARENLTLVLYNHNDFITIR